MIESERARELWWGRSHEELTYIFVVNPIVLFLSIAGPARVARVPVIGPLLLRAFFGRNPFRAKKAAAGRRLGGGMTWRMGKSLNTQSPKAKKTVNASIHTYKQHRQKRLKSLKSRFCMFG